jgi:hypothetical protein
MDLQGLNGTFPWWNRGILAFLNSYVSCRTIRVNQSKLLPPSVLALLKSVYPVNISWNTFLYGCDGLLTSQSLCGASILWVWWHPFVEPQTLIDAISGRPDWVNGLGRLFCLFLVRNHQSILCVTAGLGQQINSLELLVEGYLKWSLLFDVSI